MGQDTTDVSHKLDDVRQHASKVVGCDRTQKHLGVQTASTQLGIDRATIWAEIEAQERTQHLKETALKVVRVDQIEVEPAKEIVGGTLFDGDVSVLYGPTQTAKTFFELDLAWSIATGKRWFKRTVDKGPAVILAAEDPQHIEERLEGYRKHYKDDGAPPVYVIPGGSVNLTVEGEENRIIACLRQVEANEEQMPKILFVDTLAQATAGADENDAGAITAVQARVRAIREATGVHICLVHHTGKDAGRGARGHSSLMADVGTLLETRLGDVEGRYQITTVKRRRARGPKLDEEAGLLPVECGKLPTGEPRLEAVIDPDHFPGNAAENLPPQAKAVWDNLNAGDTTRADLREAVKNAEAFQQGNSPFKTLFKRALDHLQGKGWISIENETITIKATLADNRCNQ